MVPKRALLTLSIAIFAVMGHVCHATPPAKTYPFEVNIEPIGAMQRGTPIRLRLEYRVNSKWAHLVGDTGSYTVIFLDPRNHKDTLSKTTYPVTYDDTYSYATTIQMTLPDADTNCCVIKITCGQLYQRDWNYFIKSGNSVEFYDVFGMPPPLKYQSALPPEAYVSKELLRDTLTQEQLQIEYEVYLDLHKPSDMEAVRKIIGDIPDSAIHDRKRGIYRLKMTLEDIFRISEYNIEGDFVTPPPWEPRYKSPGDSGLDHQPADDAEDTLGFLPPHPIQSNRA